MTDCAHCHKPTKQAAANMLCPNCREDYWMLIRHLGHVQLPTLRSIMLKQAHIGTTGHSPNRGSAPLPIDTHAQNLIAESEAWLDEQAGKINATYANLPWDKAWKRIIANKHTILNMPTTANDYKTLQRIIRRNEQALTPAEDLTIIGTCPQCKKQALAVEGAEEWRCPECGWTGSVQAVKADRDAKLWELEYTGKPSEVARYLRRFGIRVDGHRINVLLSRHRIRATPTKRSGEYVFNLGELTGLLR